MVINDLSKSKIKVQSLEVLITKKQMKEKAESKEACMVTRHYFLGKFRKTQTSRKLTVTFVPYFM